MQTTSNILMIRPIAFGYNEQTAGSNSFQNPEFNDPGFVHAKALQEFDTMVLMLKNQGVDVLVVDDTIEPLTPDSIFPNNWISFHEDGSLVLYPMEAINRRLERRDDILSTISNHGFNIIKKYDLTHHEKVEKYLEGTGSLVLDRINKIAYACISSRTNEEVLSEFASLLKYKIISFHSFFENKPVYHTNVVMSLGEKYCVVCLDSITDERERKIVIDKLESTQKEIIDITVNQMGSFAGNMLQLRNKNGDLLMVMSKSAHDSLNKLQLAKLSLHGKLIIPDLQTIETNGGGSARCMIAEVFLPKENK